MVTRYSLGSPATVEPDIHHLTADQRHHGARTVASMSKDATDCALLLDMLGLDPADGLTPNSEGAVTTIDG